MVKDNFGKITALYEHSASLNPESIRRQRYNLTLFAEKKGFNNLRHYSDDGFAGTNTNRPAYQQLMEDIQNDKVRVLIVRDMARLTRNMKDYAQLCEELDMHGVRLIALNEKIDRLPAFIIDEHSGLQCELHGDYYFPILFDPEQENLEPLGKWGLMYHDHLKAEHPGRYAHLLLSGQLMDHLRQIDQQCKERFETMMEAYRQKWHITEALKAEDPMRWVQMMNNARNETEWCIAQELIFN